MITELHFDHGGRAFRLEVEDYGDSESSDTVEIYGPGEELISSYDSCVHGEASFIAEAKREIDATER